MTLPPPTTPPPFATIQVCCGRNGSGVGCCETVTLYGCPLNTAAGNVKGPLPGIVIVSPPLFCSWRLKPIRPDTAPPIENELVVHVTAMFVTFALPITPSPPATEQF